MDGSWFFFVRLIERAVTDRDKALIRRIKDTKTEELSRQKTGSERGREQGGAERGRKTSARTSFFFNTGVKFKREVNHRSLVTHSDCLTPSVHFVTPNFTTNQRD